MEAGGQAGPSARAPVDKPVAAETPAWVEMPWLLDEVHQGLFDEPAKQPARKKKGGEGGGHVAGPGMFDATLEVADLLDILYDKRAEWHAALDDAPSVEFIVFLRGERAHERVGQFYGTWRGMATCRAAVEFCEQSGMSQTFDLHVAAHGDETSHTVASAWCHKMAFLCAAWLEAGKPGAMEWAPILARYEEPAALAALDEGAAVGLRRRLAALRKVRPH